VHQNGGPIHDVMQDCILLVGSSTPMHLHAQIRTGRLPDMFFLWRTKICLGWQWLYASAYVWHESIPTQWACILLPDFNLQYSFRSHHLQDSQLLFYFTKLAPHSNQSDHSSQTLHGTGGLEV